jgi:hypothetical protein
MSSETLTTALAASTAKLALGTLGRNSAMSDKFEYLVTTTDGHQITIVTSGDPTVHPAIADRIYNVYTVGVVSDPHATV